MKMAIDGTYKIIAKSPVGDQAGELLFRTENNVLTGYMTALGSKAEIENGKVDGDNFEFTVKFKTPMGTKTTVTGSVEKNDITGQMKAMMTKIKFSGTRA
jgi:hypothetical protein